MDELRKTIDKGREIRKKIIQLLASGRNYHNTLKNITFTSYFNVSIEHHESIHLLILKNLNASAFALVRPLFETVYRALWVNKCATDDEINLITTNDGFRFPNLQEMVKSIDSEYATDNFFQNIKRESWSSMCSYTHSGLLQLNRQQMEGDVQANYSNDEKLEVLHSSNLLILYLAYFFSVEMGFHHEDNKIVNMILQYA